MSRPHYKQIKSKAEKLPGWIFTFLIVAAILWLTLAPHPLGDQDTPLFPGADKLVHAIMFGVLTVAMLFDRSRKRAWSDTPAGIAILFAAISALFGCAIEFIQDFMGIGRSFEYADMIADTSGAALASAVWMLLQHTRPAGSKKGSEETPQEETPKEESPKEETPKEESHQEETPQEESPKKKHLIRPKWLRVILKTLMWIFIVILIIPLLVYIPPVQTFLKDIACNVVKKSTGMDVEIEKFRLKFPLDVSLQGVTAVEESGDTLASVKELIADVKLLPLIDLDVKVKRLQLNQGYYHMVSADSSMIMNIRAGFLDVDSKSSVSISKSEILLNKVLMRDGDISLYMDVWKKKPTPADSIATTPFYIKASDLKMENVSFAMSMLPTIDTLRLQSRDVNLKDAVIDLGRNSITASNLSLAHGSFRYIAPTPEYVATHPAPVDTISPPSPPMTIKAADVILEDFKGVYGIKGARPQPGFDANYVAVDGVNIHLKDFFNEAATVVLPIESITATERCGLQITEGRGLFSLDSIGIRLGDLKIATPYSKVSASADVPFVLMEMKPEAPFSVEADASIGLPDIESFMPSLRSYLQKISSRNPLKAKVKADGTLASVDIPTLRAGIDGIFSLDASGYARNALDPKRLEGYVDIDGKLVNPSIIERFAGPLGFELPPFTIKGNAAASRQTYTADLAMLSPAGDVSAKGNVSLTAESYNADLSIRNLDVERFMPTLGVGDVTADIHAHGAGFNPTRHGATTDVKVNIADVTYNKVPLRDINLDASLSGGNYTLIGSSPNPDIDFDIDIAGEVAPDLYSANGYLRLRHADLQALGLTPEMCQGNADFYIDATASPEKWIYHALLDINSLDWNMPGQYIHLPNGVKAKIDADETGVMADVESQLTTLHYQSTSDLKKNIDGFTAAIDEVMAQIGKKEIVMDAIQQKLPPFQLALNASGRGLLNQFLNSSGMSLDTVYANLSNDSLLRGDASVLAFKSGTLKIDTVSLNLAQRGSLLDYKTHIGNRPGTFDEFAKVDLNGYVGSNRISAYLRQRNIQGEMGYRIGLTAAMMDSTISVHFTPLKATIAYLPWTLNSDNHLDLNLTDWKVDANLQAQSRESSILLKTEPNEDGSDNLHLNLTNIRIQDFLQLSVFAPPLTASLNSDLKIHYDSEGISGKGTLGVTDFTYDRTYVGDFDLNLDGNYLFEGDSHIELGMDVDGHHNAMAITADLSTTKETGLTPQDILLTLDKFPLKVANAFLGSGTATLSGFLNGRMDMTGEFTDPKLNGSIAFDSAKAFIPFMASGLTFDSVPITVTDNVVDFDKFDVWGANRNPLTLDGYVDASKFSAISFDLGLSASNFQLMNNDRRARSDLYGKLFLDINASAAGQIQHFNVKGNVDILGTTDITYNLSTQAAALVEESTSDVVKFVNLSDTTQVAVADTIPKTMYMRISAGLNINPGTQVTVNLSSNGTDKVQISPSGQLSYFQNYMGDMRLNGQLFLGNGFARYSIPVIGQKKFDFDPQSNVLWNGDIMNPVLHISATDEIKANVVQSSGNTRLVNFLVNLTANGLLSKPSVAFDLSTDDDMSLQNELQSMSADQRQQQAMSLLLTGTYTGPGMKTASTSLISTGSVYSFLASQLNQWAAKNIRGVDLSFGVDQYDRSRDGQSSTTTSYSYQLSKSLFNNRFKINVGGNYSTDASADENLTQNLIADISFEYMLKQTPTLSMYARLFRHTGFESILEGEITETGVGFVMKRRLQSLRGLFRFGNRKKKEEAADSVTEAADTSVNAKQEPDTTVKAEQEPDTTSDSNGSDKKGGIL